MSLLNIKQFVLFGSNKTVNIVIIILVSCNYYNQAGIINFIYGPRAQ